MVIFTIYIIGVLCIVFGCGIYDSRQKENKKLEGISVIIGVCWPILLPCSIVTIILYNINKAGEKLGEKING